MEAKTRTFRYPGMVVRVYIPELTEEERMARLTSIHKQAENLMRRAKR